MPKVMPPSSNSAPSPDGTGSTENSDEQPYAPNTGSQDVGPVELDPLMDIVLAILSEQQMQDMAADEESIPDPPEHRAALEALAKRIQDAYAEYQKAALTKLSKAHPRGNETRSDYEINLGALVALNALNLVADELSRLDEPGHEGGDLARERISQILAEHGLRLSEAGGSLISREKVRASDGKVKAAAALLARCGVEKLAANKASSLRGLIKVRPELIQIARREVEGRNMHRVLERVLRIAGYPAMAAEHISRNLLIGKRALITPLRATLALRELGIEANRFEARDFTQRARCRTPRIISTTPTLSESLGGFERSGPLAPSKCPGKAVVGVFGPPDAKISSIIKEIVTNLPAASVSGTTTRPEDLAIAVKAALVNSSVVFVEASIEKADDVSALASLHLAPELGVFGVARILTPTGRTESSTTLETTAKESAHSFYRALDQIEGRIMELEIPYQVVGTHRSHTEAALRLAEFAGLPSLSVTVGDESPDESN